jgi:transcriptional regulator with XRE-family HTH domain
MTTPSHRRPRRRAPVDPAKLKAAREAAGFSQSELARRVGVSHAAINMVEQGKSGMRPEVFQKVVTELGCQWVDLLADQDPKVAADQAAAAAE